MKLRFTIATAALALAGIAFTAPSAKAVTGTAGDLILGFRLNDNSNTLDLEVDLGSQTNFTTTAVLNLTYGASYYAGTNLGGLSSSDLDAVFGTTGGAWNALSTLAWDVSGRTGTTGTNTHLFVTQPISGNVQAAGAGAGLTAPGGRITTMTTNFGSAPASGVTVTSPEAYAVTLSLGTQTNYSGAVRGTGLNSDFGYFTTASTESLVSSSGNVSLELYNYGPASRTDLGTFTLTPTGQLTFNGSASVPEPSTFSALAGGLGLLGFLRRRRVNA